MRHRVRLITFDVTHTLLQFSVHPAQAYSEAASRYGLVVSPVHCELHFKRNYALLSRTHPNFGRNSIGWQAWWKALVSSTLQGHEPIPPLEAESIANDLIRDYSSERFWSLSNGSTQVLDFLRTTNVAVGVISNFDPRISDILSKTQILKHFAFVLSSYDIGCMKPHPDIFSTAMKLSGVLDVLPQECLHVGDDYFADYKGAKDAGWQAVMIMNKDQGIEKHKSKQSDEDVVSFPNLVDLYKFFVSNRHLFVT